MPQLSRLAASLTHAGFRSRRIRLNGSVSDDLCERQCNLPSDASEKNLITRSAGPYRPAPSPTNPRQSGSGRLAAPSSPHHHRAAGGELGSRVGGELDLIMCEDTPADRVFKPWQGACPSPSHLSPSYLSPSLLTLPPLTLPPLTLPPDPPASHPHTFHPPTSRVYPPTDFGTCREEASSPDALRKESLGCAGEEWMRVRTDHHRSPLLTTAHHRSPLLTTAHHRSPLITTDHH